jgi:ADP-ribose pyrophosphatase
MNLEEKTLHSELIFDGKIVHLYLDTVALPDGKTATREYIKHVGAVCIIPITDDGRVVLERQHRYAFHENIVEIPAGKLDHPGEDLREAALRELREETGIVPRELIDLGDYYGSPALIAEHIRMYLARGLSFGERALDEDEFLEIFTLPLDQAVEMVLAGKIPDGKTQLAILKAAALLNKEGAVL